MISSKACLEQTGLSRATLNNYIRLGLLPRPEVRTGEDAAEGAARLGYFPDWVIERIDQIRTLRQQGVPMEAMAERFGPVAQAPVETEDPVFQAKSEAESAHTPEPAYRAAPARRVRRAPAEALRPIPALTIETYDGPAYLVNNRMELIWWNDSAAKELFGNPVEMPGELDQRGLFNFLAPAAELRFSDEEFDELLYLHLLAIRRRLDTDKILQCFDGLAGSVRHRVETLLEEVEESGQGQVLHFSIDLPGESEQTRYTDLYASYFREGILFTFEDAFTGASDIKALLSQRSTLISQLMRNRKPHVTPLVVMVADLQDSVNICSELPAEEYFELINQVWQEAEPIFRQYRGTHGKHAGDGMVYYFFPQPDEDYKMNALRCALELQQLMRRLTRQWQQRKGWFNELFLNIGLHEGREWFGAYHAGSHVEFTVLGDTVNYAARLSDFSTNGSIFATKALINQIPTVERKGVHYGVYRMSDRGDRHLVTNSYASIRNLDPEAVIHNPKFRDIEMLAITEVLALEGQSFKA